MSQKKEFELMIVVNKCRIVEHGEKEAKPTKKGQIVKVEASEVGLLNAMNRCKLYDGKKSQGDVDLEFLGLKPEKK